MARPCLLPVLLAVAAVAVALSSLPGGAHAKSKLAKKSDDIVNGPLLTSKLNAKRILIVGPGEEYKTVQSAIDAVPAGNTEWVIVHLRSGVHSGKVVIPANKPFIYMRGNGKGRTSITHESDSNDIAESATFIVNANNVVVFGISFRNNAKVGEVANSAVAAMVAGDKVAFYHCAFYSSHQTLFDSIGRHYYESCYIQGSIDFIFGNGQSMFQSPEIFVKPDRRTTIQGSITAQGPKEGDNGGFVFLKGMVYGVGEVYLGRVTESNSRVIFSSTYLSKAITPAGWARDGYTGSTANVLFAEYNCTGPGAVASSRVPWSRQLNKDEAAKYLTVDFIGGKDWLPAYY